MIDVQTVKSIGILNRLAQESKHGIHPFSTATKQIKWARKPNSPPRQIP